MTSGRAPARLLAGNRRFVADRARHPRRRLADVHEPAVVGARYDLDDARVTLVR